jgi:predicted component of type VI protein secretion system
MDFGIQFFELGKQAHNSATFIRLICQGNTMLKSLVKSKETLIVPGTFNTVSVLIAKAA